MKKLTALLTLAMCLGLFTACGRGEIPDGPAELWVVTELTDKYGMNDQAKRMVERFNELYPEVTVKLDILPTEDEERAVYLQKIRTEIMGGDGPDVYLLPTNPTVPKEDSIYGEYKLVDPLFRDVGMAMHKGIFYDISEFYDEDDTLNKEELNTSVMDGVLVDDARYVLPLRYDFAIYVVDRENFEARGGNVSIFEGGMLGAMAMAAELQDPTLAYATRLGYPDYCFSQYVDYITETVLLTVDEVAEYFRLYQELNTLVQNHLPLKGYSSTPPGYITDSYFFSTSSYGMYYTYLTDLDSVLMTAKVVGEAVETYPVLTRDGTLNGVVRYYGAVGAGAEYPYLAYEFIKNFLSIEAQHETYMTSRYYNRASKSACIGWPVRVVGSAEAHSVNQQTFLERNSDAYTMYNNNRIKRLNRFLKDEIILTDEDIPLIFHQVDQMIFPVPMESVDSLVGYRTKMFDPETGKVFPDVNYEALAQGYIDEIKLYLQEG